MHGRELDTTTMKKQLFGFDVTIGLNFELAQKYF